MKFVLASYVLSQLVHDALSAGTSGYSYFEEGGLGPSNWANLDIDSNQCGGTLGVSGFGQSPITISETTDARCDTNMKQYNFEPGTCTWNDLKFSISNNGVKVEPATDCSFGRMNIPHSENKFNALQFHIHTFSEHQILGQGDRGYFPAELHVVHQEETKESFAVFGTMISIGNEPHEMFEWYLQGWEAVAQKIENSCVENTNFLADGRSLVENFECPLIGRAVIFNGTEPNYPAGDKPNIYQLPTNSEFGTFTYKGGLTTPACTEIVNWNLLDTPMEISANQLERLKFLILCYVSKNYEEDGTLKSCGHGTVASQTGSTSRPPQPLLGRTVIHRCRVGPAVTVNDVGVKPEDAQAPGLDFDKPERKSEPLNTQESPCAKPLYGSCSEDPRYNPEHSPNLKFNAETWHDAEGFWVGKMSSYDVNGQPFGPIFASDKVKHTLPYPRTEMMVFMNRTISGTRFYERSYIVLSPADPAFCDLPIPEGGSNVLGGGKCGETGHALYDERFGSATFEKDGVASIFLTNGLYAGDDVRGGSFPVDDNTIYASVSNDEFDHTYTESFGNNKKTQIVGTGQHLIHAEFPPYSENPLFETFRYSLNQVSEEDFKTLLDKAYDDARVPNSDRIPQPFVDCVAWYGSKCPSEDVFRQYDPVYAMSPYQDDPKVSGGMIALFVILGVLFLGITFYVIHKSLANQQADRFKTAFTKRIAKDISLKNDISPEALASEFRKVDKSGKGVLDKNDLRSFMGKTMDPRDFNAMFAAMDVDHNGTVDYAEFCAFLSHIDVNETSKEVYEGGSSDEVVEA